MKALVHRFSAFYLVYQFFMSSSPNVAAVPLRRRDPAKKRNKSASQSFVSSPIQEVRLRKSVDLSCHSPDRPGLRKADFAKDIGVIVAEKLKTLKVEVVPSGKKIFVALPHTSLARVSDIEHCIRSRL